MVEDTVTVAVRLRPMDESEEARVNANGPAFEHVRRYSPAGNSRTLRKVVVPVDDRMLVFDPALPGTSGVPRPGNPSNRSHEQKFMFDHVLPETSTQQEVFERTTKHLIPEVLEGVNTSIFAYGATGCGKTHTICGTEADPGLMFLSLAELYDHIAENRLTKQIVASVSYVEIYNETLRDLLVEQSGAARPLQLRDTNARHVVVAGLSSHPFESVEAVMRLVAEGNARRAMSATAANATSSRSHAILSISVSVSSEDQEKHSIFNIIDLAGSERAAATENRGIRLTEGACINRSLLALGTCIKALANRRGGYVPYRDSKLTRLLKSSLSGSCRTVMIVCVAPTSKRFEETLNTLNYANRAKNIRARGVRNETRVNGHVLAYRQRISRLVAENIQLKEQLNMSGAKTTDSLDVVDAAIATVEGISSYSEGARCEFEELFCAKRELWTKSQGLNQVLDIVQVLSSGASQETAIARIQADLDQVRDQYNALEPDRSKYTQFVESEIAQRRTDLERAAVPAVLLRLFDAETQLLVQRNEVQVMEQLLKAGTNQQDVVATVLESLQADGLLDIV